MHARQLYPSKRRRALSHVGAGIVANTSHAIFGFPHAWSAHGARPLPPLPRGLLHPVADGDLFFFWCDVSLLTN